VDLEYVPLLKIQRELLDIPRGRARFDAYLRTILNEARDDVRLVPLVAANPMAREHVADLLDAYLAIGADDEAARDVAGAAESVADVPGAYRIGLVVVDDLRGGWTNRWAVEYGHAFESESARDRGWLAGLLWSSEPASLRSAREAVLTSLHRAAERARHGPTRNLRERMAREGQVLAMAGCTSPTLDPDDLDYTRAVIAPLLDADDRRTCIECLYGDPAARSLGLTPRGLTARAGLALALAEATAPSATTPCCRPDQAPVVDGSA
jgi:hypothetical protein